MDEQVSVSVDRERFYNPFAELTHASWALLENGKELKEGYVYQWMSSILAAAFAFEGFLNLIGGRLFPCCWKDIERSLSPDGKLKLIACAARFRVDCGIRPYQTISAVFKFRNELAHPKPQRLEQADSEECGELESLRRNFLKVGWEKECSPEFAERALKDVEAAAQELWKAAGLVAEELRARGRSYTIKRPDPTARETEA